LASSTGCRTPLVETPPLKGSAAVVGCSTFGLVSAPAAEGEHRNGFPWGRTAWDRARSGRWCHCQGSAGLRDGQIRNTLMGEVITAGRHHTDDLQELVRDPQAHGFRGDFSLHQACCQPPGAPSGMGRGTNATMVAAPGDVVEVGDASGCQPHSRQHASPTQRWPQRAAHLTPGRAGTNPRKRIEVTSRAFALANADLTTSQLHLRVLYSRCGVGG